MATGQYNSFPIDWKSIDATKVPYSNATSGLSAADVQGAIDELNTDLNAIDASDIPYDNTASGLTADDVQEALDELASEKQDTLTAGDGITISSDTISTDNDATLTSEVKPAQAKAVGDALSAQETATEEALYTKAPVIVDTVSGAIASFPDGADGYPLKECVVNIEAVQSGSGDPSPTNVRPISGWSEAKVTRDGKNLVGSTIDGSSTTSKDVTFLCTGNHLKANGTASGNNCDSPDLPLKNELFLKAGQNYIFSLNGVVANADRMAIFPRKNGQTLVAYQAYVSGNVPTIPFTPDADISADVLRIRFYTANGTVINIDGYWQIEVGSTATAYEPYNGQAVTIDLDGTRYGCTLDVRRGKLSVTHKYWTSQGTAKTDWVSSGGGGYFTQKNYGFDSLTYSDDGYCNMFIFKYSFGQMNGIMAYANRIQVSNSPFSTLDEFFDAITATPIQLVYPLATPIEVDLTPTEITTLLGTNNLWSDTGDVEVEYCADTKRYIQKLISQLA